MDPLANRLERYYLASNEWRRLDLSPYHRLELDTTLRFLKRYLPPRGLLLDAGGGPGRYTIALAKIGYQVVLLDLLPKHLTIARREIRKAGVQRNVSEVTSGSIEDLSRFRDASFDAVLCLGGPLGHLVKRSQRTRALTELARVAKAGAPVFVSVIGRLSVIATELSGRPQELEKNPDLILRILRTGDYDGSEGFAPCHFFLLEELQEDLRATDLRILASVGLEGLASGHPRETIRLAKDRPRGWAFWGQLHRETCTVAPVAALSEHFLVVTRKPRSGEESAGGGISHGRTKRSRA